MLYKGLIIIAAVVLITGCKQGISKEQMENGRKAYVTYCQGCHMEDGKGVPDLNAPLVGSKYIAGDDTRLISIVLKGSAAFAGDPARTEYKNTMPSLAAIADKDIAAVLTYLRNSFENKGKAITPEEVRSVREKTN